MFEDAGELTIQYTGNKPINAERIYLRGDGFLLTSPMMGNDGSGSVSLTAERINAHRAQPGVWNGETSNGQIMPGDEIVAGVVRPYTIRVVWDTGSCSQPLYTASG